MPKQATPKDGREWYLPHHRVYHLSKPDKVRVVFDCSVEFNRRFINKELIPGPDLANQVVGVLTRFRENKVAFMTDIEKIFSNICCRGTSMPSKIPLEERWQYFG